MFLVPSPPGIIKINDDASVKDKGWIGMGIVARYHEGRVIFAATRRVKAYWPLEVAKAKALAMALCLGHTYNIADVVFESDCNSLINKLIKGNM